MNFDSYLIIVNIVGFFLYFINMLLYRYTLNLQVDKLLTLISFMGGSLGIIIFILLFDRKAEKENMMSRVFVSSIFVIQLILFLFYKDGYFNSFNFKIWELFIKYKFLGYYLIIINIVTFIIFLLDKLKAIYGKWRIKIVTLLGLCFIGGSIGGLLSMYLFHHKTNVDYFTTGIPLIIVMQVLLLFYLVNIV